GARLGLAPHSLRAVPPEALRDALAGLAAQDATAPIHIHIAEQTKEVEDCVAWSGQRPVAWLLDHAPVDARWCLVHATHMDADEYRRAATTGAVAGLCPTTEANLGDGLFDLPRWTEVNGELGSQAGHGVSPGDAAPARRKPSGGAWGIGSDSHACVDAAEELLMLEYGQRLIRRQRNVAATEAQPEVATALWLAAVAGGAQAAGRALGGLAVDQQADLVVLDAAHPVLAGLDGPQMLSAHVFAAGRQRPLAQAYVAGRKTVDAGCHPLRAEAQRAFVQARRELLAGGA
uniref:amidohydrolase family protein n=1 Tax=Pseudacidovorax intermedius TaxID=433924 RepID=UPI0005C28C86